MSKISFKDWYCEHYCFDWPGYHGERIDDLMMRLADAMAAWADMVAAGTVPDAPATPDPLQTGTDPL